MTTASTPGPVTFVLSGGASLGAIQVGMLRALAGRGVVPDTIVATSVGAINGAPISQAIGLGARQVYVLPTGGPCALTAPPRGALAVLLHATGLMVSQRFTAEVASVEGDIDVVVLPPPCPLDVQPMDFGHAETLISRAEADAGAFLDGLARTVVPLRSRRGRRRGASDALAELPPAS